MSTQAARSIDQVRAHDSEVDKVETVSAQDFCSSSRHGPFTLLVVSAGATDYGAVRRISNLLGWRLHRVSSCHEALSFLTHNLTSAVMCDCDLPDGTWEDISREISRLPSRPPLILVSPVADARIWAEVLNLRAHDLLAKPFDKEELVRALSSVWRHWKAGGHCD